MERVFGRCGRGRLRRLPQPAPRSVALRACRDLERARLRVVVRVSGGCPGRRRQPLGASDRRGCRRLAAQRFRLLRSPWIRFRRRHRRFRLRPHPRRLLPHRPRIRSLPSPSVPALPSPASTEALAADSTPPSQPASLSFGSVTESELTLSWGPATDNVGVVAYDVFRNGSNVASVSSTSFTHGGLVCDSLYWFGVEARDAAGNRSARARAHVTTAACAAGPDKTAPTNPSNLAVRGVTQTTVALSWSASSDDVGVVGYDAFRNGAKVVSVPSTSIAFGSLACGTSYWFGVAARDAAGNRSGRTRVSAKTSACGAGPTPPPIPSPPPTEPGADTTAPTEPTNLAVRAATRTSVSLTWSRLDGQRRRLRVPRVRERVPQLTRRCPRLSSTLSPAAPPSRSRWMRSTPPATARPGRASPPRRRRAPTTQPPTAPTNVSASSRTRDQHRPHLVGVDRTTWA